MHNEDPFLGNLVETAIYSQWLHMERFIPFYARWQKGEVDMVKLDEKNGKPEWALEIKWSNQFFENPGSLKSLLQFMADNDLSSALVTTVDKQGTKEINGVKLIFIPAAVYAYTVGRNTLLS
jgi:hypothetical protein